MFQYFDGRTYKHVNEFDPDFEPSDECGDPTLLRRAKEKCIAASALMDECVADVCATGDLGWGDVMIGCYHDLKEEEELVVDKLPDSDTSRPVVDDDGRRPHEGALHQREISPQCPLRRDEQRRVHGEVQLFVIVKEARRYGVDGHVRGP